jgi:Fe(3+) dicitrate transport protein
VEVVVAGSRARHAAGSVHVVSRRQLERFRHDDPNAIVLQIPGVYVRQEDGVGLRPNIGIRGANADRSKKVTLMEDGVLFGPAPYSAPAAYYFPLMSRMIQVRAIKGPSAIQYGPQTVGGALDFVTRYIPDSPEGQAELSLGEYGYAKAHAHFGASSETTGFLVEGIRLHDGGFKDLPSAADTGSTRNDWMVKGTYDPDPYSLCRHRFSLKLSYADEVSNETYLGLTDTDFRDAPTRRYPASALDQMKNHRTGVVLTHQFDSENAGLTLETNAYRQVFERAWRKLNGFRGAALQGVLREPDDPANAEYHAVLSGSANGATAADTLMIGPNDRSFVSQGVQTVLGWNSDPSTLTHRAEVGLRLHNDSIHRRHSQSGYVLTDGLLVPEGTAEEVTASQAAATYALAVHASNAMTWRDLTLTPGVRVELIWSSFEDDLSESSSERNVQAVMPGAGAYYALSDELGALGGVYRGFSPPAPGTDDHVEPEISINYEAGLRYTAVPLRAEVIGFYNDTQNLTDVCTLSSGCLTQNLDRQLDAGAARIFGVEAQVSHEPRWGAVRLPYLVSYTFTEARFQNSFTSGDPIYGEVQTGDFMPYIPAHQVAASFGVENDSGGAVVGANYVAPMREEVGSEALDTALTTDEQFWLDAGASFRPLPMLTLQATLKNVLGSQYIVSRRPYGARPNAPRWLQIGAKLSY